MIPRSVARLLPGCELEGILDSLPLAIFLKDRSLRYTWCNTQFEQFCGCPRADISGKTAADFLDRVHAETATEADLAVLNGRERQVYDGQVTCPCGQLIDVRFVKTPAIDRNGETVGIIGVAIDTSNYRETERLLLRNLSQMTETNTSLERFAGDLQSSLAYTEDQASRLAELAEQVESQKQSIAEQNRQIRLLMHLDQNTGIHNRRYFFDAAPTLLAEACDPDRPGILAVADLDHFKRVNDTHGHAAGDQALRAFARVSAALLPEGSLFCRIGGEEFVILIRPLAVADGVALLNRVRTAVADHRFTFAGKTIAFTISLGAAPILPGIDLDDLLRTADAALYRAKRGGRNRIFLADPAPPA